MGRWPNAQQIVLEWLRTRLAGRDDLTLLTEEPSNGDPPLPRVVIELPAQSSDGLNREVDVEVTAVAASLDALRALTADLTSAMWALAGSGTAAGYVDEVREEFGFGDEPSANREVRRAIATFSVVVRPSA